MRTEAGPTKGRRPGFGVSLSKRFWVGEPFAEERANQTWAVMTFSARWREDNEEA